MSVRTAIAPEISADEFHSLEEKVYKTIELLKSAREAKSAAERDAARVREQLELREGGVLVNELDNGAASKAGIRKGDVIVMFNGVRVKDTKQFGDLVDKAREGAVVPVLVQRSGGPTFLAIKIPDKG